GCFALCWEGSGGNSVTWKSDTEPDAKISAWSELLPALRALKRVDAGGNRPMPVLAPIPLSIPSYEQRLHWDDSQLRRISPHFGYAAFVVLASLVVLAGLGVRKRGRGTRTIVLACVCAVVCTGVVFAAITSWHSNKKKFHAQQDQYSNSSPMYAVSLNMENALHYVEAHPDAHQRASRTFHGDTVAIATISEIGHVKALMYGEDEIRTPPGALLAVFANNNGLYSLESGRGEVLLRARTLVEDNAPYVRAGAESIPLNDFSTTLLEDDPMGRALLDAWLKHLFVAGRDWEITIWRDSKKSVYIDFSLLPANPIDNPPSSR
ncbi:MAG: hypothetical protein KDB07_13135, partial [Planctomycetes bacterium]|nr:hypothetical protein [Planctomycetota bacterium]